MSVDELASLDAILMTVIRIGHLFSEEDSFICTGLEPLFLHLYWP